MAIELTAEFITPQSVEKAYQLAQIMQKQAYKGNEYERKQAEAFAQRGMRGAFQKVIKLNQLRCKCGEKPIKCVIKARHWKTFVGFMDVLLNWHMDFNLSITLTEKPSFVTRAFLLFCENKEETNV
jgi:hypothetical protein